jgi:aspartate/methionine/tyrosine aminotransferase
MTQPMLRRTAQGGRSAGLQPTAINSILAEVRFLQAQGREVVSLMRGEPDMRTPEHITEAAVRALRDGRTHYPDNRGEPALRAVLAERTGYNPADELLVTTGATFGIYAALMAVLDEGDEVLLPDPIYDAYQSPVRLAGGRVRSVASTLENDRFRITREELEIAWTPACRVLLLNSPWNPTGTVLTRDELGAIAEFAERHALVVISDEIYEAITYDGRQHISPASVSPEMRARTIIVNSFSKTYAMTGWRAGYCAGPAELIGAMYLVLQQSSRGPAMFVQDACVAALAGPQQCVAGMRAEYALRRGQVLGEISGIRGSRVLAPEGGFFAILDARGLGRTSEDIRKHLLYDHGVAVVHGAAYGRCGEGMLRVSFAAGGDKLKHGLQKLREGITALS